MPLNIGYLQVKTDKASDEVYTPETAVLPLLKYIDKSKTIWCPFDLEGQSKYIEVFKKNGIKTIASHEIQDRIFLNMNLMKIMIILFPIHLLVLKI